MNPGMPKMSDVNISILFFKNKKAQQVYRIQIGKIKPKMLGFNILKKGKNTTLHP